MREAEEHPAAYNGDYRNYPVNWQAEIDRLRVKVERLMTYATHRPMCALMTGRDNCIVVDCSCGLREVLRA